VWVGIDGYSNSTVEQLGTEQDVINGKAVYDAWWEMYSSGKGQPEQVITGMTIQPGDSISASVTYLGSNNFQLSITDSSHANDSFTITVSSSSLQSPLAQRTSAEWIVEAPSVGGSIATVANFGSVTFTNASATINGVTGPINSSSWQNQAINIAVNGTTYDTTSVLTNNGTSFVETYNTSAGSLHGGSGGKSGRNLVSNVSAGMSAVATTQDTSLVIGPGLTPTPVTWNSRTPIRQGKPIVPAFSTDSLLS
jgi:hypothetical protein